MTERQPDLQTDERSEGMFLQRRSTADRHMTRCSTSQPQSKGGKKERKTPGKVMTEQSGPVTEATEPYHCENYTCHSNVMSLYVLSGFLPGEHGGVRVTSPGQPCDLGQVPTFWASVSSSIKWGHHVSALLMRSWGVK